MILIVIFLKKIIVILKIKICILFFNIRYLVKVFVVDVFV